MKKKLMAAALVGAMLLSGCSQENSSSTNSENTYSQTEISSSESTSSETSMSETISEDISKSMVDSTSTESNNKQLFLEKVNYILESYDYITKHNITENDDIYSATYIASGGVLNKKLDTCTFILFYTDDVDLICETIVDNMNELIGYMDLGSDFFDLYINDADNNHIVSISNTDYISLQNEPCIYWDNVQMQDKFKKIEENEIFNGFDVKVVNK